MGDYTVGQGSLGGFVVDLVFEEAVLWVKSARFCGLGGNFKVLYGIR